MTDRTLRGAIAALALAGVAITSYLVYARYSGTRLACTTGGCETVQHSRYAKAAGIPVAVLGLAAYAAVLATTLSARIEAAAAGAAIVLAGLAFGIYLIVIQVAVIEAICQWCLVSDGLLALLAVAAAERLRRAAGSPQSDRGEARWRPPRPSAHSETMTPLCALNEAIGNDEECPRTWCAFWEHGGAVVEPGCTIERLGIDLANVDLAHYLLDLRRALDNARSEEEARVARERLAELVPPDLSGA